MFALASPARDALESGFRRSDIIVTMVDPGYPAKPNWFFEPGAAIGMGKRFSMAPKGLDADNLPFDERLRRYLIRDSPEQTADWSIH